MQPVDQQKILNTMIEFAHDGILFLDPGGYIISANPNAGSMLGFKSENDIRQSQRTFTDIFDFYDINDAGIPLEQFPVSRALTGERSIDYKVKGISKETGKAWYGIISAIPMFDETKSITGVVVSIKDISDTTMQSQRSLAESEELFRLAFMVGGYGVYDFDIPATRAKVNSEYLTMLEYKPGEVQTTFDWWNNSIHPEDHEQARSIFFDCIYGKTQDYKMEFRMRTKSGGYKWVLCQGKNVEYDKQGKPVRMVGTHIDITDRKRMEQALREERDMLTQIAATVPGVIYSYHQRPDGSAHLSYASPALFTVLGLKPEEVANDISPLFSLIHPNDIGPVLESIAESARTNSTWHKEFRYNHPAKGEVWIEAHSVPQPEADGGITWHGFGGDITERKQSEEALRLSEEKFSKAFMTSPDAISITRVSDGALIEINNGTIDIFGFTREEMYGHTTLDMNIWVNKDDRDRMLGILYASGEVNGFETLFRHKDGKLINGILSARTIRMNTGDYILSITRDITEQKRTEDAGRRLTRELRALNSCNEVLMRVENEQELLDDICRIICEVAGYRMAWVGFEVHDEYPYIKVVARASVGEHFMIGETYPLNDKGVTANDIVMRSKKSCIIQDIENAPKTAAWRDDTDKNGYRSAIALPLLDDAGNPFGVLSIYSGEPNVFAAEEVNLLEELGGDLAFGIRTLRSRVERKIAQNALIHEKELSDALIEAAPGIFCVLDRNGGMLRMNKVMMKLMERSPDPAKNVYKDDLELVVRGLKQLPDLGHIEEDIRLELNPGEISWWRVSGHAVTIQGTVYLITVAFDITQRKQVEENLKKALKEKEVLIHELYHRTKNNMQVITSFLAMQAIAIDDEKLRTILNEMENRIAAMALVHEKLYKSKDLTNVDLRDYLNDLANLLFRGYHHVAERVKLVFEAEDVFVTIDIAIPLGMVVTELFTNSLKYAFPDARSGRILLRMKKHDNNELNVTISDNGIGVPDTFDLDQITTIGIPTVLSIVRKQLRGSIELDTTDGFNWKISFRSDLYGKRV